MAKCAFAFLLAAGLLPAPAAFAQEGVGVSTAAAGRGGGESPLTFNIEKNGYGSRVSLDYSLRWDFSDLRHFRPGIKTLTGGLAAAGRWDITENTRLKYYGFSTNPWRLIIAREKGGGGAASAPGAGGNGRAAHKKRLRLSLSPLVDDFSRNLDENLRNLLLESSFSGLSPEWRKVSRREKKEFFRDVLSLDIWAVPGLDETRKGLEYISK